MLCYFHFILSSTTFSKSELISFVHIFFLLPPGEPNKHSLCSIQLTNNMLDHVAFKVWVTNLFLCRCLIWVTNNILIYDALYWDNLLCWMQDNEQSFFFRLRPRPLISILSDQRSESSSQTQLVNSRVFTFDSRLYIFSHFVPGGKEGM